MSQLQFELASPVKMVFNKPVAMVAVPGAGGQYGVLPGHAPMITGIAPGIVEISETEEATVSERYFVTGGYCEVTALRCTLLADAIIPLNKLVRAEIEAEIKALNDEADALDAEASRASVEARLAVAQAKLMAAA